MIFEMFVGTVVIATAAVVERAVLRRRVRWTVHAPSSRTDTICDRAFVEALRPFNKRQYDPTRRGRIADARRVDELIAVFEDRALTVAQIKRLYKYTHTPEADAILDAYFGIHTALQEAVDLAEQKVAKCGVKAALPLISVVDFEAFCKETDVLSIDEDEIMALFERYPFSFTRAQRAIVLSKLHSDDKANRKDARQRFAMLMQIHDEQQGVKLP